MNSPRCDAYDYIQFLLAAQRVFSCTEAARCQPEGEKPPAHDAFTRLLQRQPPDSADLWQEVRPLVQRDRGVLVLDDTTLDKPYARKIELVTRHWSGKHRQVVLGINLLTLLWTDGEVLLPCDFRIYDKPMGEHTKNEHFRAMLAEVGIELERFPTAGHLASWAIMCPGDDESAGRRRSGKTRKGSLWLRTALVEAAHGAAHSKNTYLAAQFHRLVAPRGKKKALVAVGHSILIIVYHMLRACEEIGFGHPSRGPARYGITGFEAVTGEKLTSSQPEDTLPRPGPQLLR